MEILSAFDEENLNADKKTFSSLLKHISQVDKSHVVVMIQVENEIGMLNEARDHYEPADKMFSKTVPQELMDYIQRNKETLKPEFKNNWTINSSKETGTWEEVFGKIPNTDEIFMAWNYSRYTNKIAEAGKVIYPLPMYINAALNRPNVKPGDYPSAGPLPHLMDVWLAGAPSIDFLSPDIYFDNIKDWIKKYQHSGNPIFIPEIKNGEQNAAQVFYVIGQYDAMGFSPFSIESTDNPEKEPLTKSYDIFKQLSPLILKYQGKGLIAGVLVDKDYQKEDVKLGNFILHVSHDYTLGWSPKAKEPGQWPESGCIIISTGNDEYFIGGTGIVITFDTNSPGDTLAGIASIDEGKFVNGKWIPGRRMNGDQDHQGRHLRIPVGDWGIQNIKLYRYH
jgi:hypothetical protein